MTPVLIFCKCSEVGFACRMTFQPIHQAWLIQFAALLFIASTIPDGGIALNACILASALFWACAGLLLLWHHRHPSRMFALFLRWGLLLFATLGTVAIAPILKDLRDLSQRHLAD